MQETRGGVEGTTRREEGTKVNQAAEAATTDGGIISSSSASRLLADLAGLRTLTVVSCTRLDCSQISSRRECREGAGAITSARAGAGPDQLGPGARATCGREGAHRNRPPGGEERLRLMNSFMYSHSIPLLWGGG